ncbi:MAG: hypothetical protein AABY27_00490 [Pseudomonadota bacterium]
MSKKTTMLNECEAYEAMFNFLEAYYNRTKSDDIGSLLGDLQLLDDKQPADPAAWRDWLEAIQNVVKS